MIRMRAEGTPPSVQLEAYGRRLAKATSIAMAGAIEGAKEDLRRQAAGYVGRFGKGRMGSVANAIRGQVYPAAPRFSLTPAGVVYANGKSADRIFSAFATGPIITPRKGKVLAIPLHQYRDINRDLLGPKSSYWGGRLEYIPLDPPRGGVVGILAIPRDTTRKSVVRRERNTRNRKAVSARLADHMVPQFLLVRQVRHPKVLSPREVMGAWAERLPGMIETAMAQLREAP